MKILMLVLNEQEETAIEKITTALSDFVQFEDIRNIPFRDWKSDSTNAGYFKAGRT